MRNFGKFTAMALIGLCLGIMGLEHERCGEMVERIGLVNFLEGIGVEVDPNMIAETRTSSYVRMDDWDIEAKKWFDRKAKQKQA